MLELAPHSESRRGTERAPLEGCPEGGCGRGWFRDITEHAQAVQGTLVSRRSSSSSLGTAQAIWRQLQKDPHPRLMLASSQLPQSVHRAFGKSPRRDGVNIWNCQPGAPPDVLRVLAIHKQMEALGTGGAYPAPCGGGCCPLSPTPVPQNGFTTEWVYNRMGLQSIPCIQEDRAGLPCSGLAPLIYPQDMGPRKRTDLTWWIQDRLSSILGTSLQWAQGPTSKC